MDTISRFLLDSARYLDLNPAQARRVLCIMQRQRMIQNHGDQRLPLCA
jgi:hypothetical protein